MDWFTAFIFIFGLFVVLLAIGLPIAFTFLLIIMAASIVYMGPLVGPHMVVLNIYESLATFTYMPVPLFIFMGEIMLHSGVSNKVIDAFSIILGRLPARLSYLTIASGTLFAALTGSTMANCAILSSSLLPEMTKRRYSQALSLGPLLASGGLAMIIPPSTMAVIYGTAAQTSVGKLLIAGILPGLVLATSYAAMVFFRCKLNPSLAPQYDTISIPFKAKLKLAAVEILPLGSVIFLVTGIFFFGVATPTEAAALGTTGSMILVACYGRLNFKVIREATMATVKITGMAMLIICGSVAFSQILSYTGVSKALVTLALGITSTPALAVTIMMVVVVILGCLIDQVAIIMVTVPIFMPLVIAFNIDPVWFGMLMLMNLELGFISPPFGMLLFVLKGFTPKEITMGDIYRAAIPFCCCDLTSMLVVGLLPGLATYLPSLMLR
jgi:tripartite ATP-independent transporter DctM subunit